MLRLLSACALAIAPLVAAQAQDLRPTQAQPIALGGVQGVAYYTVENDGFHVVATVATPGSSTPVRMAATLLPGQRVTLSTAAPVGHSDVELALVREGDSVHVEQAPLAVN